MVSSWLIALEKGTKCSTGWQQSSMTVCRIVYLSNSFGACIVTAI